MSIHQQSAANLYIPLKGATNFRDAGGHLTLRGGRMRLGMLYRSDALNALRKSDLAALSHLNIGQVVDLRTLGEQVARPDRLPGGVEYHFMPITLAWQDPFEVQRKLFSGNVAPGEFETDLSRSYGVVATLYCADFSRIFRLLLQPGSTSMLIHCTGGKDRTGMAVALIQSALGVPRETIFEGYLYSHPRRERTLWLLTTLIWGMSLLRTPPPRVRPLLEARRAYLQSFFDSIERQFGSVQAYLLQGLGLTQHELELLNEKMIEAA
jgi:protein-tyrosine phosphatase